MMRKIIGSNIALHTELFFFQTYSAEYGILAVENTFELVACSGADAGGNWQPTLQLRSDRQVSLINTAQGIAGNRFFRIEMTDGMRLKTVGSSEAILKADNIATSDKTFQFPNASGILALTSDLDAYLPLAGGIMAGNLDMNSKETLNFIIQSVDTLPDPAVAGRMVRLSTDNNLYFGKIT